MQLFEGQTLRHLIASKPGISVDHYNWSHDARYVYFKSAAGDKTALYRVGLRDPRLERIISLKDVRRTGNEGPFSPWSGLTPDDSPLVLRDIGTQEIYALDVEFP